MLAPDLAAVAQSGSLILPDITTLLSGLFLQTALVITCFSARFYFVFIALYYLVYVMDATDI